MLIDETNYLSHYGILRKSGRYPWGSGGNVASRSKDMLGMINDLKKQGLSETDIAKGLGFDSTTDLRAAKTIARNELRASQTAQIKRMRDKGMSFNAIGERLEMPPATVRSLLSKSQQENANILNNTADMLKRQVDAKGFIDVGTGVENLIGISRERLNTAVSIVKDDGYLVYRFDNPQLGTGKDTKYKVLCPPGTMWKDVVQNKDKIHQIEEYSLDGGRSSLGVIKPIAINPKRVEIVYAEDGGSKQDGVMYIRPGKKDLYLGGKSYAQVRIQVGDEHYLKGMAMYNDNLPSGTDVLFHTNKSKEDAPNKLDVLKPLEKDKDGNVDQDNPFGAVIKRVGSFIKDKDGNDVATSAVNIVYEEGDWVKWSKSIAPQMLSKQKTVFAKEQLDMAYNSKKNAFDEIQKLTNSVVKKKLLKEFSEDVDSSAVHLKAASLPRQASHVILPVPTLKTTEVYAPRYKHGETVVLIRYPHGGKFEIPELTVNNRNAGARKLLGVNPLDAIGINHKVAEHLSGADFDGDTVLVIPNNSRKIHATKALDSLKNFDPRSDFPGYPGMKRMKNTGMEMGEISNLITDMTIKNADLGEISRAVRHSMVVIDAEKHGLNYKESEKVHGIKQLKDKYQIRVDDPTGKSRGASTLISRSKSPIWVPDEKPREAKKGGPIDKKTGELVFEPTGKTNWKTGNPNTIKKKTLEVVKDAHTISSGSKIEEVYADHSNRLKSLGSQARLSMINTPPVNYSPSAKSVYKKEVGELDEILHRAKMNRPRERQAQLIGTVIYRAKLDAHPDLTEKEKKKIKYQALEEARHRVNAKKPNHQFTSKQWEAIQAGAITGSKLEELLDVSDMDHVRDLATPQSRLMMSPAKSKRARSMMDQGYTREEVASYFGVSVSTLDRSLSGE